MKHVPIRSTLVVVAMLAMLIVSLTVSAQAQPAPTEAGAVRWLTYVDPRFDFSIKYPSNWQVIPRDDSDPNVVSGSLVFAPIGVPDSDLNADPHDPGPHIVVVPYLAELKDGQSLSEWTEMYESLGNEPERSVIQHQPRQVFRVNGAKAVHEEGVSPLTTYQYTNIAHKNMVWDIWTNIPSADPSAKVYERMVRSFRFGRNAPANLREAYSSNFTPLDMEEAARAAQEQGTDEHLGGGPGILALNTTWQAPVKKSSNGGQQFTATCGSTQHDDIGTYASLAVDILMPKNTGILNAKLGTVTFAGWDNYGYGNLIRIQAQGGKEAFYAHLTAIYSSVRVGTLISTGTGIGLSGNTGTSAYHLHFHVQWSTAPEDLTGMYGFTSTGYPVPVDQRHSGNIVNCAKVGF